MIDSSHLCVIIIVTGCIIFCNVIICWKRGLIMGKKSKLRQCSACGKEIASSVKVCPYCGEKFKKPIYKRVWFWILIIFILLAAIGTAGNNTSNSASSDNRSNENQSSASSSGQGETLPLPLNKQSQAQPFRKKKPTL